MCHGSYFVNASDLADLDQLNLKLYQVQNIVSEVKSWPEKIKSHQNQINKDGINDRVIENFDVSTLISISERYGDQAIEHALSNLRAWHEQHFWKSKKAKQSIDISQGDAVTA